MATAEELFKAYGKYVRFNVDRGFIYTNFSEAFRLLEESAKLGYGLAQAALGHRYLRNDLSEGIDESFQADYAKAKEWFEKAAAQSDKRISESGVVGLKWIEDRLAASSRSTPNLPQPEPTCQGQWDPPPPVQKSPNDLTGTVWSFDDNDDVYYTFLEGGVMKHSRVASHVCTWVQKGNSLTININSGSQIIKMKVIDSTIMKGTSKMKSDFFASKLVLKRKS